MVLLTIVCIHKLGSIRLIQPLLSNILHVQKWNPIQILLWLKPATKLDKLAMPSVYLFDVYISLVPGWSAEALFVGPSSTGEKSSNLHHILATAYHYMPSINGSTIGHRWWWAVHITIEDKIRRKGFSHIGTKSLELSTPRHQTGSLHKQL